MRIATVEKMCRGFASPCGCAEMLGKVPASQHVPRFGGWRCGGYGANAWDDFRLRSYVDGLLRNTALYRRAGEASRKSPQLEEYPQALRGKSGKNGKKGRKLYNDIERAPLPEYLYDKLGEVKGDIEREFNNKGAVKSRNVKLDDTNYFSSSRKLNEQWEVLFHMLNGVAKFDGVLSLY
ncbi:MAG: hypothetical protein LBB15_02645 [Puniceicoccales bacterium]|nr:hypothetical protein [Puniceicoccales bacterium]